MPKNWCLWTAVFNKTLESTLDGKEIKPVNTKGNQSWTFIGRTVAEATILWPPDVKNLKLIGKDPDDGWVFSEGKRRKGCQRIRWSDSITDSMNMNLSKLWKIMEDGGACFAIVLEVTKSWTWLSHWTTLSHYVTGCRPSKNIHVVVQSLSHVNSLRPHGLQHTRLPCPSPSPGACSNSCLLSQWCHPTISSSVIPFSSCLQSFPSSRSFPMIRLFTLGGHV